MSFILVALLLVNISVTAAVYCKLCLPSREKRTDAAVEREMEKGSVDEGFENIMRYSVNGKTGFEEV